jgi:hypothetical protein
MEFFGKPIDMAKEMSKERENKHISDDLFWYIVDHDKLHKDFFYSIAKKIKGTHKTKDFNKEQIVSEFMPMVKKGCMEFYQHHKMNGKLETVFSKELRKDMCERLFDHYKEDIVKDQYKLGQ